MDPRTVRNADGWRGYHGLVDRGYGHCRGNHANDVCGKRAVSSNGSEGGGALARVRLAKSKGLPKHTSHLYLKTTAWRYHHHHADQSKTRLRYLRQYPFN